MNAPRLLEGLSGIDWGSPDTYETADEPHDANADANVEKCEDSTVQSIEVSVKGVHKSLKGKYLDSRGVDFSDAPNRGRKTGYNTSWEISAEEETTSQKLHRIVSELDELSTELESGSQEKKDISVANTLQEIGKLRQRVGTVINSQVSTQLSFPTPDSKTVKDLQRIITTSSESSSSEVPVYRLFHHPDGDKHYNLAKTAELEARLSRIESALGNVAPSSSFFSSSRKQDGILDQLSQFESKLSLLDPAKLDMVDARLASVLSRMQSVTTSSSHATADPSLQLDSAKLQKLLHLHEILNASQDTIQSLPKVIGRLTALGELHNQAVQMVDGMAFVEKSQATLDTQLTSCEELLDGVSRSLEQTSADISAYCKRIEEISGNAKRKP